MATLLGKQKLAARRLGSILQTNNIAGNWSETGTGKTVVNLFASRELRLPPLVIAPLITHSSWEKWAKDIGVPLLDVINVEQLRTGKTRWAGFRGGDKTQFLWNLDPKSHMVIWDEFHRGCSGAESISSRLAAMLRPQEIKSIIASATPFDSPLNARAIGYLFGLHQWDPVSFYSWCKRNGCTPSPFHRGLQFKRGTPSAQAALEGINQAMADRTVRLQVSDLAEFYKFGNVIEPLLVDLSKRDTEEANRIYREMETEVAKKDHANGMTARLRARQRVELLKAPALAELVQAMVSEGASVFVGLGFRESVHLMERELNRLNLHKVGKLLGGGGAPNKRANDEAVAAFNRDELHVLVATQRAGGVGINLHQEHEWQRPRRSLISPTYSADDLIQALGRIFRLNLKGSVVQRIVMAAGTVEELVYRNITQKAQDINTLTDADLE